MSSALPLCDFLEQYDFDIALLSEHKLLPRSIEFFKSVNPDYYSVVNVDNSIDQYEALRCVKGGTAIMYKTLLHSCISQLDTDLSNDRSIGIEIN